MADNYISIQTSVPVSTGFPNEPYMQNLFPGLCIPNICKAALYVHLVLATLLEMQHCITEVINKVDCSTSVANWDITG
jgi:hypothetical protein